MTVEELLQHLQSLPRDGGVAAWIVTAAESGDAHAPSAGLRVRDAAGNVVASIEVPYPG